MSNELTHAPTPGIIRPLVSPDQAVQAFDEYQNLALRICRPEDKQRIGNKEFRKKSFWRKINKFFGLVLDLIKEEEMESQVLLRKVKARRKNRYSQKWEEVDETEVEYYPINYVFGELKPNETIKRTIVVKATYRATASNGQYVDGDGSCDIWEKGYPNSYHNIRATAHTRAKNRAISDLVGFGEVSAEEITGDYSEEPAPQSNQYQSTDSGCRHPNEPINTDQSKTPENGNTSSKASNSEPPSSTNLADKAKRPMTAPQFKLISDLSAKLGSTEHTEYLRKVAKTDGVGNLVESLVTMKTACGIIDELYKRTNAMKPPANNDQLPMEG